MVVQGGGVAATVVACVGTAGIACAAGAAGAAAITSLGTQALDNAGQPVRQAAMNVDWGRVGVDTAIGAVSGPIGGGASRITSGLLGKGASPLVRAIAEGSSAGGVTSGIHRTLLNYWDNDPTTNGFDGTLEACVGGALIGSLTGRAQYTIQRWVNRIIARSAPIKEAPSYTSRVYRVQGGTLPRASRMRIDINSRGGMDVVGNEMLFVTFDDIGRVKAYVANNR